MTRRPAPNQPRRSPPPRASTRPYGRKVDQRLSALRAPIVPDRLRRIDGKGFSFIPHSFLRHGFLERLSRDELALYLFLVLAGNRNGVSFYRYDAICGILSLTLDDFIRARAGLIHKDLIAFDGSRFQVLSLPKRPQGSPPQPLRTQAEFQQSDPATIRATLLASLESDDQR